MQSRLLFLLITTLISLVICVDFDFKNSFEKHLLTFKKENQKRNVEQTGTCSSNCTSDSDCSKFSDQPRFCQNGQCVLKLPDGSICNQTNQCSGDCIQFDSNTKKCGYTLSSGCSCTSSDQCQQANCIRGVCVANNTLSSGSNCRLNSECQSNSCVNNICSKIPNGGICSFSSDCLTNSYCNTTNFVTFTGICVPKSNVGGFCQFSSNCLNNLYCNFTSSSCANSPVLNQNCPDAVCAQNLYCSTNNGSGICLNQKSVDSSCSENKECLSNNCVNNKCWDLNTKDLGQNCTLNFGSNNCKNFAGCINGICTQVPLGSPCLNKGQCSSSESCNCLNSTSNSFSCNFDPFFYLFQTSLSASCNQSIQAVNDCFNNNLNCQNPFNCCLSNIVNLFCDCYCSLYAPLFQNNNYFDFLFQFPLTGTCANKNSVKSINTCSLTHDSWSKFKDFCSGSSTGSPTGVLTSNPNSSSTGPSSSSSSTGGSNFGFKNFEINFNLLIILSISYFFGFFF